MSKANKLLKLLKLIESEPEFWKDIYDKDKAHWKNKTPSNLVAHVINKYGPFKSVLEIGCAAGIDTFELAKKSDKIVGIDIVPKIIKLAKENLKDQSVEIKKKVTLEVGDCERLKYKDNSFDFVYSLSVLHSTDPEKSLKEIRRVLTDDGYAVIYIFVGGKEGADKKAFLKTAEEYFNVEDQKEIEIKDKDGDNHKASIFYFGRK